MPSFGSVPRGRLALVDVDGTLLPASSERLFLGRALANRILPAGGLFSFAAGYVLHPVRTVTGGCGWNRRYLEGAKAERVASAAMDFSRGFLVPSMRTGILSIIHGLASEGFGVVLVSASLAWLVIPLAGPAGASAVFASEPVERDGRLTGTLSGRRPYGKAKLELAEAVAGSAGTSLNQCAALGDAWSDRFLLSACGRPVAVHPGRRLRALALSKGWRIAG